MTKYLLTNSDAAILAAAVSIAAWINADAAIGSSFGAMFFMLSNGGLPVVKRFAYASISLCVGYGAGLACSQEWAMLVSLLSASVAVVTITSLSKSIESGELSGALKLFIDLARGKK